MTGNNNVSCDLYFVNPSTLHYYTYNARTVERTCAHYMQEKVETVDKNEN
jgi:hypothetical protein